MENSATKDVVVSVAMITYNHAPYIEKAVRGVLEQRGSFAIQLVIGEDCSTDGTREIVQELQEKYPENIHLITSAHNVGVSENARRTLDACTGEYLAFCEGDDHWHDPDKLRLQLEHLQSHPDTGLIYTDYDEYWLADGHKVSGALENSQREIEFHPTILDVVSGKCGILTCTVLTRTDLVRRIIKADPFLHSSGHFKMGDTQLWAEIANSSKIGYLDRSTATHNLLPESLTQSKNEASRLKFWISNSEMCIYLCDKYGLSASVRKKHEQDWIRKSLKLAYFEKDPELADSIRENASFSLKDWVWYLACRHRSIRALVHAIRG